MPTLYGHGSWIALAVFFGLFALRALSSQRHRPGQRRGSPLTRSFTDAPPPTGPSDAVDASSGHVTSTGIAPCWLTDPSGRHEQRYWSGSEWTEHVRDAGVPGTDPPPGSRPAEN
ncbi:MAG TPA: DUF2510 domain-containing protein [Acidimicrobiales bacterium]|nr:DUF2510 domain-containing protein [Acidimicrobiales bacterium]